MTRQRSLVYTVGADPLLVRAVVAELPRASVVAFASVTEPPPFPVVRTPDIVLIGLDVRRPDLEREAVLSRWGRRPLIVEAVPGRPLALVWLGTETVRVLELTPGFLIPFLVTGADQVSAVSRWQPVRGRHRLVHAAASLLMMAALTSASAGLWARFSAPPSPARDAPTAAASSLEQPPPPVIEPNCPILDPC